MQRSRRHAKLGRWMLAGAVLLLALRTSAETVFAPPEDSADAAGEVKAIERELAEGNYSVAAKRLDLLLGTSGPKLLALRPGTLTSVGAWVDQLPSALRQLLAREYEKTSGQAARQRLEALDAAAHPEEFYLIARRYPMTQAAGIALIRAGDRAAQLGDFPAAQAYYELALREGAVLGDERTKRLDALRNIDAGQVVPLPADLKGDQGAGTVDLGHRAFAGQLPFDATWYGDSAAAGNAKFLPGVYDGRIVLASWKNVTVLRENGQRLWDTPNPRVPRVYSAQRAVSSGRGALFAPAVLTDLHGRPVTIVVRQPGPEGETQFALRALDAADGRILWSTDSNGGRDDFTFSGLPTVSGRYVYSVAVAARDEQPNGELVLCALDTATGESLWQTTLGTVVEQEDHEFGHKFSRGAPLKLGAFAHLAEPCVSGDLVIASPNCGAVIAVGRFDGRIRWVCTYRVPEEPNPRQGASRRNRRSSVLPEGTRAWLARYKASPLACGNVIVALPQDAASLLAMDRVSGKLLWSSDIGMQDAYALAGASGNMVVACGASLMGIDAGGTGKLKWRFSPDHGVRLTGPASVMGETVVAPTSAGILQLSVIDGTKREIYKIPSMRQILETDGGRGAVVEAGANHTFGAPPASR